MKSISPTLAMNQLMNEREKLGLETYRLGFGASPFPVPDLLVESLKKNAHRKEYLPSAGLSELREAIAAYYSKKINTSHSASQVIVGPGSKELIFLSQLILERELILPSPSWVSYAPQSKLLHQRVNWINTSEDSKWMLSADALSEFLINNESSSYLLILNYPNNPTGATFSGDQLEAIAEVCRRHDVIVISDEIYAEYSFSTNHTSIMEYYSEGTIICSGLSKWLGAGGWRLGYAIFPDSLEMYRYKLIQAASESFSCVASPIQYAAIDAFRSSEQIEAYTQACRTVLAEMSDHLYKELSGSTIQLHKSEGGFYNLLYFNSSDYEYAHSKELCTHILNKTGVALLAGDAFGILPELLTARLAYVDFDGAEAIEIAQRFSEEALSQFIMNTKVMKAASILKSF